MELDTADKLQRLEVCRKIRNIAAQTCLYTFQQILAKPSKISEMQFGNIWRKKLEKLFTKGFVSCWYDPPPNGIAVLFADEKNYERVNYPNLRPSSYWPQSNVFLKPGGLGYIFASPYSMIDDVPIIGDFGFSFYLGKSNKIKNHFIRCYKTLYEIIDKIKIGVTFSQLFSEASKIIKNNKLKNHIVGYTDKAGTDFGHTIPFIDRNPDVDEISKIRSRRAKNINQVISEARIFSNESEDYRISDNCAFTFEPRFVSADNNLPMFSLHTIIQFVDGKKIILENFNGIFNLLGMDWLKL